MNIIIVFNCIACKICRCLELAYAVNFVLNRQNTPKICRIWNFLWMSIRKAIYKVNFDNFLLIFTFFVLFYTELFKVLLRSAILVTTENVISIWCWIFQNFIKILIYNLTGKIENLLFFLTKNGKLVYSKSQIFLFQIDKIYLISTEYHFWWIWKHFLYLQLWPFYSIRPH